MTKIVGNYWKKQKIYCKIDIFGNVAKNSNVQEILEFLAASNNKLQAVSVQIELPFFIIVLFTSI